MHLSADQRLNFSCQPSLQTFHNGIASSYSRMSRFSHHVIRSKDNPKMHLPHPPSFKPFSKPCRLSRVIYTSLSSMECAPSSNPKPQLLRSMARESIYIDGEEMTAIRDATKQTGNHFQSWDIRKSAVQHCYSF